MLCVVGKNCSCGCQDVTKPPILSLKPDIFTKNSPSPFLECNIILPIKLTQCTHNEVLKMLPKDGYFFRKGHRAMKSNEKSSIQLPLLFFRRLLDVIFIVK